MLGNIESRRRRGLHMMRWLDGIIDSMDMSLSKLRDSEGQGIWQAAVYGVTKSQMFLAAFFIIDKTWMQAKCLLIDEWIK